MPPAFTPLVDPIMSTTTPSAYRSPADTSTADADSAPTYRGRYFFADLTGRVWSMGLTIDRSTGEAQKADLTEHTAALGGTATLGNVTSFGLDAGGELYIVSYSRGVILKVLGAASNGVDFDDDGKADLAVFRPSSGDWFIRNSTSNFTTSVVRQWGLLGDVPVPGDYDGDGTADLAVWRPSSGIWFILQSSTSFATSQAIQFGVSTDVPVPGDYDGDGKTDPAVYRPVTRASGPC